MIINGTYKAQNLPKNSERTKNKKNTQKLWIRKSLTEQMRFQMSLEFVMLQRLLGSEFQTVRAAKWNERSMADLRLTRGILSSFQKMSEEHVVVEKCSKQKTNMEEEYPQNDGKPKQPVYIGYEIPKAASGAQWGWV